MAVHHALDFGSMRLWGSMSFTVSAIGLGLVWERAGFTTMFLVAGISLLAVFAAALLLDEAPRIAHPSEQPSAHPQGTRMPVDPGLLFLLASTFLIIAALFMAGTFGAVYMNQLGGSQMMVGALMGCGALGEVPGMLFGGRVARRIGPTSALLIAYAANALGLAATGLAREPWLLLVFALLRGLGFGLVLVATVTIINTRAPKGYTSTYQGILNAACWGLAPLLGGPISGWIFQTYGPSGLFFTAGSMALGSCLFIAPTYRLWKKAPAVATSTAQEALEEAAG
jgi:PPP family 3-phenylpropionic acid transporter